MFLRAPDSRTYVLRNVVTRVSSELTRGHLQMSAPPLADCQTSCNTSGVAKSDSCSSSNLQSVLDAPPARSTYVGAVADRSIKSEAGVDPPAVSNLNHSLADNHTGSAVIAENPI